MIKLVLKTNKKDVPDIEQEVKVVAVKAFTRSGFEIVKEEHTVKEIKNWMKNNNIKFDPKSTLEQLVKLL